MVRLAWRPDCQVLPTIVHIDTAHPRGLLLLYYRPVADTATTQSLTGTPWLVQYQPGPRDPGTQPLTGAEDVAMGAGFLFPASTAPPSTHAILDPTSSSRPTAAPSNPLFFADMAGSHLSVFIWPVYSPGRSPLVGYRD